MGEASGVLWVGEGVGRILAVHAPYPGPLKFDGTPSSLLYALGPLARKLQSEGRLGELGVLDPRRSSEAFYDELASISGVEVALVSTSTVAIEEAARIAALLRGSNPGLLLIGGGPHEDDALQKMAERLPDFDLSIGGDADELLLQLVEAWLSRGENTSRERFLETLPGLIRGWRDRGLFRGAVRVASAHFRLELQGIDKLPVSGPEGRGWLERATHFRVFPERETFSVLLSRGCSYGGCSFCAEAHFGEGQRAVGTFEGVVALHEARKDAAFYFQDSIFPRTPSIEGGLLPLLREFAVPWGCQVYLKTLSRSWVEALAAHGCRYVYTGIESGSERILRSVGKEGLTPKIIWERLAWVRDAGMDVGLSLMFGAMSQEGELLEDEATVEETMALARNLVRDGGRVAGFYPNVFTLLPGTEVARGFEARGVDFYRVPRSAAFDGLEDGPVGYNFLNLSGEAVGEKERLAEHIALAAEELVGLGRWRW